MEKTVTANSDVGDLEELKAAIARTLTIMDELRERTHHDAEEIQESRQVTRATLADIAEVLADLKAA